MGQTLKWSFESKNKVAHQTLSVESLKDYQMRKEDLCETPHIHDFTEILWMIRGSGKMHLDLQVFEFESGYMYFIKPGEVHKFQFEKDSNGYILSAPGKFPENGMHETGSEISHDFLAFLSQQKPVLIDPCFLDDMKDMLDRMIKETCHRRDYSDEILHRYFSIFLFLLRKQLPECHLPFIQNRNMQVLQQFKEMVNKHYKTKKMVSDYASDLNLTPNYLNEIIKKVTGHSAGHLIRQRVALEAKRYALHSGVCMKEIGYHLGFSDMAHFSKFFKSVVGSNFTDFKNAKVNFAMI